MGEDSQEKGTTRDASERAERKPGAREIAASVRKPRGFAAMAPEIARELSHRGGIQAHLVRRAHEFTSEEAKAAGRLGGLAAQKKRRASKKPSS